MTFLTRFCYYCGEGQQQPKDIEYFACSECNAKFFPPVTVKEPDISLIHAIHNFHQIELTDKKAKQAQKRNKKSAKTL